MDVFIQKGITDRNMTIIIEKEYNYHLTKKNKMDIIIVK